MKVLPNSVTAAIVVFMGLWPRASGQRTDDTIDVELTDDVIDVGLTDDALDVNGGVSILSSCTVYRIYRVSNYLVPTKYSGV